MNSNNTSKIILILLIIHLLAINILILLLDNSMIMLLTKEDGLFESLGAVFLLITSIFFFILFQKDQSGNNFLFIKTKKNIFFLCLGLIFFVGFGEEINWGQRIFKFQTPSIIETYNVQKEFNFHNLDIFELRASDGQRKSNYVFLMHINVLFIFFWFSYCVVIPMLNKFSPSYNEIFQKINLPVIPLWIGFFFIIDFILSRLIGGLITGDIRSVIIISSDFLNALMEIEEFTFSFLFMMAGLYLLIKK